MLPYDPQLPVIDMIAGVDDLAAAEAAVPVLEGQSWVHAFHRPRAAHATP